MEVFQIKQRFKSGSYAWIQFLAQASENIDHLKQRAIVETQNDWELQRKGPKFLTPPVPPSPTIHVTQIDHKGRKIRNGLSFKLRWR